MGKKQIRYVIGIDVGLYSLGVAAIEIGDQGRPVQILNALSHIHDGGVDPNDKDGVRTRKQEASVARRTRRLIRRRVKRLARLDDFLREHNVPIVDNEANRDPYYPWRCRAELATVKLPTDEALQKMGIAVRHMARHRGWRNSYTSINSLAQTSEYSPLYYAFKKTVEAVSGHQLEGEPTIGQLVLSLSLGSHPLRGKKGVFSQRLHQGDYLLELKQIAAVQELDQVFLKGLIEHVFVVKSPKGSALSRVGRDPLQPAKIRALKATDAFQQYRILGVTGNLRIIKGSGERSLTADERTEISELLLSWDMETAPTWDDVAAVLGVERGELRGTASIGEDGERFASKPPIHATNVAIAKSKCRPLRNWWKKHKDDLAARVAMIQALSNAEELNEDTPAADLVLDFIQSLSDKELETFEATSIPFGRAAYSQDTLQRLVKRMEQDNCDVYTARQLEFNTPNDWQPPADPIGVPVGNPAVDRVLKQLARWLAAVEKRWGKPERVNIEHVRDGFSSALVAQQKQKEAHKRFEKNQDTFSKMEHELGITVHRKSDLYRYQAIQRQNCCCLYCGEPISFKTAQMDHIVPRAGAGSTNTRNNLVAVCEPCNKDKSNQPFAVWARTTSRPVEYEDVLTRVKHWLPERGQNKKEMERLRTEVLLRLKRTSLDEPIDARSLESTAWMATELRSRIQYHFQGDVKVNAYSGVATALARKASGIERQIPFIGGAGKTRFDRRHHAVDALVIALMNSTVAKVLAERDSMMKAARYFNSKESYLTAKQHEGAHGEESAIYRRWVSNMEALVPLITEALTENRIPVTKNLRLRLGDSKAHKDTIHSFKKIRLGDAMSTNDIDAASSPALWCALTRLPDYDEKLGLPSNAERRIWVNGNVFEADDSIDVFSRKAGSVSVRNGFAELGKSFHHTRIYRINGKSVSYAMLRVYAIDLIRFRSEDLFSVDLPPQSMSMRKASKTLRQALSKGIAEYVTWIVKNDELYIDKIDAEGVNDLVESVGPITSWTFDGFHDDRRMKLRPRLLSREGIPESLPNAASKIIKDGWLASMTGLFGSGANVVVVRRNVLGIPRTVSRSHFPITRSITEKP